MLASGPLPEVVDRAGVLPEIHPIQIAAYIGGFRCLYGRGQPRSIAGYLAGRQQADQTVRGYPADVARVE